MVARSIAKKDLPEFSTVDYNNQSLARQGKLHKIYERTSTGQPSLLKGPETPIVDPASGILYILTEEANLVSLTDFQPMEPSQTHTGTAENHISAKTTLVADLGVGRPLGAAFANSADDGSSILYVADALLGLVRVSNLPNYKQKKHPGSDDLDECSRNDCNNDAIQVEIIASSVKDNNGRSSRILYANDVDVGPITGHVYFTDSSSIAPQRITKTIIPTHHNKAPKPPHTFSTWDTMMAFKRDLLRGERSGRLLRYKPETDEVDILMDRIWFANGVAVDQDESFVMVSETCMARELKYDLTKSSSSSTDTSDEASSSSGQVLQQVDMEIMLDALPGFPDGACCSRNGFSEKKDHVCYVAIPSPKIPLTVFLNSMPEMVSVILRTLILQLPSSVLGKVKPVKYGGVAVIEDVSSLKGGGGKVQQVKFLQDPTGTEIGMITGLATFNGNLYMGSLSNDFVGVYKLQD